MGAKGEQTPATNQNPVLSVDSNGTIIHSNEASEPILKEWGVRVGEKLPSSIVDLVQRVISRNSPEKTEVKVRNKLYLVVFSPLPEQECVNIPGFDISGQEELEKGMVSEAREKAERDTLVEELRKSEKKYHMLFDTIDEGFCVIEVLFDEADCPIDYRFLEINASFERQTGIKNAVGRRMREIAPEHEEHWFQIYGNVALTGEPVRFENPALALGHYYDVYAFRTGDPEHRRVGILFNDIRRRKRAEEALRKSEERFHAFVTASSEVIYRMSPDWAEMRYLEGKEFIPDTDSPDSTWLDIYIHPDDQPHVLEVINEAIRTKSIFELEHRVLRVDGTLGWIHSRAIPILDENDEIIEWFGTASDITERKLAEEALKKAHDTLEEKVKERTSELEKTYKFLQEIDVVRKQEIHHRIKNNLQVIFSLLDLQAEKFRGKKNIEDSKILEAFKESQDRVISMALIHEELHKGGEIDTLNFSHYIEELTDNLLLTYRVGNNGVILDIDIEEDIFFDMDTSVPLGIIVNELVSNSLKYAFPDRDIGEIRIKLQREENTEGKIECNKSTNYVLSVSDNGIGVPEDLDIEDLDSLGLQLVTTLIDQLDGELELRRDNGTEFIVRFSITERNRKCALHSE